MNETFDGLTPIVGVGADVTTKVTVTDCGVLVAPPADIETMPVWLPTERPPTFAPTVNDPVFVPEATEPPLTVSQVTDEPAVQLRVPVPPLVTVTDWLAGFAPF